MKVTAVWARAGWGWPRIGTLWLGHFVLLGGDTCLVTRGRKKHYCMVISSEHKENG
jgi:hypothetical protein